MGGPSPAWADPPTDPRERALNILNNFTAVTQKGIKFYSKVRYLGLAATVAMSGVGAFVALVPGKVEESLINRSLTGGTLSVTIAWMAWVLAVRPQITLSEKSIKVRNWVTESVIPYGQINRVSVSNGLTFKLRDGSEIRGRVVGTSMIGQLVGYPSAKLIRREILPFMSSADPHGNERILQTFSLSLRVPLVVAALHTLLYGFSKYIFQMS
ncbi:hypothetical protein ACFV6Z_12030 [Streptomyces sp. NPDC059818]|uniref:hypothetical protein n=1 Tax=Streptomyces sp. NPDC059818 TaxID=3346962 RepID=UPI003658727F